MSIAVAILLVGCTSTPQNTPDRPAAKLYADAEEKLHKGDFRGAITYLEALDNQHPYGAYSASVQLHLAYAYYKTSDWALAQTVINRFIRLNATHPNIDYMHYLRGLTNMALDDNLLQRLCKIDRSSRDTHSMQDAFHDFKTVVTYYPQSLYAADAQARLIYLKNYLAKHELAIANYYNKRQAYVAVVNRVTQMLQEYPDTAATRQALPLLHIAYRNLNLAPFADKIEQLIKLNPVY